MKVGQIYRKLLKLNPFLVTLKELIKLIIRAGMDPVFYYPDICS